MKNPIDKKKLIFGITALVLVVVIVVGIVMSRGNGDIEVNNSEPDTIDVSSSTDTVNSQDSTDKNNSEQKVPNNVSMPTTNSNVNDGKHINDLNNMGKKATLKNNCYSTGYPIADKTVTFNVMIKDYTNQADYEAMKINQFIADKMNIKINWTLVGQAEVTTKLQLAYASGNLPDLAIGMAPYAISLQWKYIKQGLVRPLDDYIENYAPNVKRLLKENADARYAIKAEDGHYYSLPMLNEERKTYVFEGLYINKTWLDNLKLGMPNSTNSFMKVLNAFKNNDPNGNGKADEIPMLLQAWNTTGILPGCLYGPFGLPVYGGFGAYSVNDKGKVIANYTTDNYRTAITYYRTLYKNGLIEKNWFTNDPETVKSKLNSKTVTVGAFVSGDPYSVMDDKRVDEYVLVPPFRDKSADKATWSITGVEYAWGEWFLVTKACKYPEVAVRFADYFYSLEGTMTALQGPQGLNWNVKPDGTIYMTENYYKGKYKLSDLTPGYPLPNYASKEYFELIDVTKSKHTSAHNMRVAKAQADIVKTYLKAAPKNPYPSLTQYTTDVTGTNDHNELAEYVRSLTVQFLNGSVDINVFWDNYVSVCKSLGSEIETSTYQKAYDRYAKEKKK
ncbi:MAG: hypothetical protein IKK24_05150 [Clostridia bacterium]|nr:hypothetical protein [Clostridia bacterium]